MVEARVLLEHTIDCVSVPVVVNFILGSIGLHDAKASVSRTAQGIGLPLLL
jgi:hypothetical protein